MTLVKTRVHNCTTNRVDLVHCSNKVRIKPKCNMFMILFFKLYEKQSSYQILWLKVSILDTEGREKE